MRSLGARRSQCRSLLRLAACIFILLATLPALAASAEREAAIRDLVLANHILAAKEVLDGYGHVSVRDPDNPNQYLLARSMAPGLVAAADIMTFDLDSKAVGGDSRSGYLERFIHGEIYRTRPDVKAIVHSHTPEVIPFAATGVPLRPLYHMTYFIGFGVPVYEIRQFRKASDKSMLVHDQQLAQPLARVLGDKAVVLMRGHGAVIVARTLPEVVGRSVYLKQNAVMQATAMALSKKVSYLEAEEGVADIMSSAYARDWAVWNRDLQNQCAPAK